MSAPCTPSCTPQFHGACTAMDATKKPRKLPVPTTSIKLKDGANMKKAATFNLELEEFGNTDSLKALCEKLLAFAQEAKASEFAVEDIDPISEKAVSAWRANPEDPSVEVEMVRYTLKLDPATYKTGALSEYDDEYISKLPTFVTIQVKALWKLMHVLVPSRVDGAISKYVEFLKALRHMRCVPTLTIDAAWHAHMYAPEAYREDTLRVTGFLVGHDFTPGQEELLEELWEKTAAAFPSLLETPPTSSA